MAVNTASLIERLIAQAERYTMAVNTASLIERLIAQAELHDTFGRTDDGDILREAAAALAEATNEKAIANLLMDVAFPKNKNYTAFIHLDAKDK